MLSEVVRKWREKNPDKVKATFKRHYERNRQRILTRNKKWRDKNKEHLKQYRDQRREQMAAASRFHEYGLLHEDYLLMLKNQKYRCKICKEKFDKTPHVDHDHETGQVRGLLCRGCNSLLGFAKESPTILSSATQYLRDFGKRTV